MLLAILMQLSLHLEILSGELYISVIVISTLPTKLVKMATQQIKEYLLRKAINIITTHQKHKGIQIAVY